MNRKSPTWIRHFDVKVAEEDKKNFTLYEVTSIVFAEGFPETATKIRVKKRFKELSLFHAALQKIHASLFLKGDFPAWPKKASFFKRFEPQVSDLNTHGFI